MIPNKLSATFAALAPALGNHLWQSTLFAIAAGVLTLILRKNHARARYWLWLAASMKFLIPFSLLIGLGSRLAWSRGTVGTNAGLYFAMDKVGQPFTQPAISIISRVPPSSVSSSLIQLLPSFLAAVWLGGFLAVVFVWYLRWRRVSRALRHAEPLREGREVETLLRLQRIAGRGKPIEMFLSGDSLEPGIFGMAWPVLVWPKGISERLGDAHLEAILAHEVWHVRRRDNLAAALHMFVEAVFWFHPLVWWLGARLVEERERACDEAVLESGSDRQIYAESILKICEFCVGSPLACISGVSGADLKNRIARIMTERVARQLDFSRKLLLSAAGLVAVAVPIAIGLLSAMRTQAQSQAQSTATIVPKFEVASIKPSNGTPMAGFEIVGKPFTGIMWKADRLMATNFTLRGLIRVAYAVQDEQISGGSDWINSEGFDIDAKVGKSVVDEMPKLGRVHGVSGRTRMLQALLADRFKLSLHSETKEIPVFALVIAKNGLKLQEAKPGDTYPNGIKGPAERPIGTGTLVEPERGTLVGQGVPVSDLVENLSQELGGRIIVDKTGLKGKYDFTLRVAPEESQAAIFTALQEQLGLKLETQKLPIDVLVIDHAEKPAEPQAQNAAAISPVSEAVSPKPNKSDNAPVGINSQPQNTAAIAPSYEITSIKSNKFNNPTGRIELHTQNTITEPRYEVASIKPNKSTGDMISLMGRPDGFTGTNITLQMLIRNAYEVEDNQISGGPSWIESEKYDIEAKMDGAVADELRKLGEDQSMLERQRMLQALLADRFKLSIHFEAKEGPAYALVIAKNGPKLQEAKPGESYANGIKGFDGLPIGPRKTRMASGELTVQALPMVTVARLLSMHLGRTVLDKTGLMGSYDFTLLWTPEEGETAVFNGPKYSQVRADSTRPDSSGPSIFAAIQEQLGLKLESQKGPVKFLVIDHVERPSDN
jgi:bla regulator protein BlaR1